MSVATSRNYGGAYFDLGDFLRAIWPQNTAKSLQRAADLPAERVHEWLHRGRRPNADFPLRLVQDSLDARTALVSLLAEHDIKEGIDAEEVGRRIRQVARDYRLAARRARVAQRYATSPAPGQNRAGSAVATRRQISATRAAIGGRAAG